jgi:hypothetical protein
MKKTVLSMLLMIPVAGIFAQNTEIKNGDMEIWKAGKVIPAHWGAYYNDIDAGIYSQSKDAHSGKCAIQMDFEPKRENDNRRFFSFPFNLEAGVHAVTLYLKGKGEIRFISLTRKGEDSGSRNNENNIVGIPAISDVNNSDWKPYTVTYDVKDAGAYQLFFCVNAAEKLLIDDVTIKVKN